MKYHKDIGYEINGLEIECPVCDRYRALTIREMMDEEFICDRCETRFELFIRIALIEPLG